MSGDSSGDDRLRDAVGGVLRAWKGAGGSGGLSGLERALRGLERAYGALEPDGSGSGGESAVLGYGYRVLAGDASGAVYALRWGASGAITGVIGPIEGVPVLPGGVPGAEGILGLISPEAIHRQLERRKAALEALPDPGSLEWVPGLADEPGRVQWARAQSWRFVDRR